MHLPLQVIQTLTDLHMGHGRAHADLISLWHLVCLLGIKEGVWKSAALTRAQQTRQTDRGKLCLSSSAPSYYPKKCSMSSLHDAGLRLRDKLATIRQQ